ncbi:aminopeptidase [Streptomyces uncialis]|uniref:aminopeptidase n=1 Tax=Streptomyces uncialis TaxID=1048205 RepID=UPI003806DD1F
MRHTLRWLLSAALVFGTAVTAGAPSAAAAPANTVPDVKAQLQALPGVASVRQVWEIEPHGTRLYELQFDQLKDHRDPSAGTFRQRVAVRHRSEQLPTALMTVFSTQESGRLPVGFPYLTNDVSVERRFTGTSQPTPKDLTKLDIRQLADDLHRITISLKGLYQQKWISTGEEEDAQTAIYHRRFHPTDVHGTFVLGGRNDVDNAEDSAYDQVIANNSTPECTDRIKAFQREALTRRGELLGLYQRQAQANRDSHQVIGSADKAFEISVTNYMQRFWNTFNNHRMCVAVPLASAPTSEIWNSLSVIGAVRREGDQHLRLYEVEHYLAGTRTGWPSVDTSHLDDLLRYPGINQPRSLVDRSFPMTFDNGAMADVDRWVREEASGIIFFYAKDHPMAAERFQPGEGSTDTKVFYSRNGEVGGLDPADLRELTETLNRWAGRA